MSQLRLRLTSWPFATTHSTIPAELLAVPSISKLRLSLIECRKNKVCCPYRLDCAVDSSYSALPRRT
jgi:hypothetical protein